MPPANVTASTDNVTDTTDNVTRIRALASRLKRQTTNRDILELIEFVLRERDEECPACKEARLANRARQLKWRMKRNSPVSPQ